jgi:hypothetical protein
LALARGLGLAPGGQNGFGQIDGTLSTTWKYIKFYGTCHLFFPSPGGILGKGRVERDENIYLKIKGLSNDLMSRLIFNKKTC